MPSLANSGPIVPPPVTVTTSVAVSTIETLAPALKPGDVQTKCGSVLAYQSLSNSDQPLSVKIISSPAGASARSTKAKPSGASVLIPINAISPALSAAFACMLNKIGNRKADTIESAWIFLNMFFPD